MSFILDALKKSESERRLGQTPSLQDTDPAAKTAKQKPIWLIPLLAILLVAAVIGWSWNEFVGVEPSKIEELPEFVSEKAAKREVVHEYISSAAKASMKARKSSPIATYTPPPSTKTGTDVALPDTGKILSISPAEDAVTKAPPASTSPAPLINEADEQAQRLQRLRQQRESERAEDAALVAAVESRLAAEAANTATEDAVRFRDLSAAVRSSMPDLKVTTQVYAQQPENRFAIVNGKRHREGDEITDDVIMLAGLLSRQASV